MSGTARFSLLASVMLMLMPMMGAGTGCAGGAATADAGAEPVKDASGSGGSIARGGAGGDGTIGSGSGGEGSGTGGQTVGSGGSVVGSGGASAVSDAGLPGRLDGPPPMDGGVTPADASSAASCGAVSAGLPAPYNPVYRIQLLVHRTRSDLTNDQLCGVLSELNKIWWTQAAVCFEIRTSKDDQPMTTGLDLWLERSTPFPDGVTANGVTAGPHSIYVLDHPSLARAPHPVMNPTARTMAHELGHALSLQHQNPDQEMNCLFRGTECDDLLMRSGHNGFQLTKGTPANVNEQGKARTKAMTLAMPDTTPIVCGAAQVQ